MLKLLIAAWLVTHSLGRPDVSHLFKQNHTGQRLTQQNKSSFLEYLDSLNGTDINELNVQARQSSSGFASRIGQFGEFIQPSPFKRNTEDQGYTYEKPTVSLPLKPGSPFDYPFNPDANLIKPVSTQAPEYLPPSELDSFTSPAGHNLMTPSSQAPAEQQSYPESTHNPVVVSTQVPQDGYSQKVPMYEDEISSHGPTQKPTVSSTGYNGYTQGPVTQTGALESRFENGYTGHTQEPMTSTINTFNGKSQGTTRGPAPDASSDYPGISPTTISSVQETIEGDQGYNFVKPVEPQIPNLNEKIGEPLDINELATTTVTPTTTRKFNGHIIPPKPLSELNVPIQESTSQTPGETYSPVTASVQITTRSELGHVTSTSAPEYLPPDDLNTALAQDIVPEKPIPQDPSISNRFDQDTSTADYNQETAATSGYPGTSQDNNVDSASVSPVQGTTSSEIGYTSINQETSAPDNGPISTLPAEHSSTTSSDSTPAPEYNSDGQSSTYESFNDAPAEGFTPSYRPSYEPLYSTATSGPYDVPSSTSAPDYLPPGSDKQEGFNLPSNGGFTSPNVPSTTLPEYRPEQPSHSSIQSETRFNTPTETSNVPADNALNSETNPESGNVIGFSIVVEETTSSVPLELSSGAITSVPRIASTADDTITTYHPSSTHKPIVESEAEESELKPRVAIATPTTAYNTQQPTEGTQRPSPVGPSHTLESDGYHYKIPSIPFP